MFPQSLPRFVLRWRQATRRPSRFRKLDLEPLDSRWVLSGMPIVDAEVAAPHDTLELEPAAVKDAQAVDIEAPQVQLNHDTSLELALSDAWAAFPPPDANEHPMVPATSTDYVEFDYVEFDYVEFDNVATAPIYDPGSDFDDVALMEDSVDRDLDDPVGVPPGDDQGSDNEPEIEPPIGGGQTTSPPVISEFDAELVDGYWEITGVVDDDESVEGLQIDFGGILSGESAIVNADGFFSIVVPFPPGTSGLVTAVTTDADGLTSNQVVIWIQT